MKTLLYIIILNIIFEKILINSFSSTYTIIHKYTKFNNNADKSIYQTIQEDIFYTF